MVYRKNNKDYEEGPMHKIQYPTKIYKTQLQLSSFFKRFFDIAISFVLLLCLSPFLLLFSILLFIFSRGPIFFKQTRTGKDNIPFTIWKFRTMEVNHTQKKFHDYDWREGVPNDFVFKTPCNQRITKIGKIYRKLSIDELPQLINVLCGEMSLVGPRPEIPEITNLYSRSQSMRLRMRPGITGYAQVNGRSGITHGQKIKYDLFYINNYSFVLDVKVVLKTIGQVIWGKGAW